MTQSNVGKPIVLRPKDGEFFDWNKVVIEDPISYSYNIRGRRSSLETTTSKVYFDDNGVKRQIFIELPEQFLWNVMEIHPLNLPEDRRSDDTLEGYQIGYPLTSISTVDNPTKDEQATNSAFDSMFEITCNAMKRFCSVKRSECKMPRPSYSSYATAKADNDWSYAVKPLYDYQKSIDKNTGEKFVDKSKPLKSYIKLFTRGKGKRLTCLTDIYGPGDKKLHPKDLKKARGDYKPAISWEDVFWGNHGGNSHGASIRLKVIEMNFTPSKDYNRGVCNFRILSPNTAPLPQEEQKSQKEEVTTKKEDQKSYKEVTTKKEDENLINLVDFLSSDEEEEVVIVKKEAVEPEIIYLSSDEEDEEEEEKKNKFHSTLA